MRDIHERKRLKAKEHILDHMGSTELAANLFRATQTEEKLRRENVRNKDIANRIHNEVGRKVEGREKKRLKAEQKKLAEHASDTEA